MTQTLEAPRTDVSPEPLYRLALGFACTKTLLAANRLGIFPQLALGPQTGAEVARALGLEAGNTEMLLDACVSLGLCAKEGGRFTNTAVSNTYLIPDRRGYLGRFLDHFNDHMYPVWFHLEEAVRTGKAQVGRVVGQESDHFFEAIRRQPRDLETFMLTMEEHSLLEGAALASAYDFSPHQQLLDVGGGTGAMSTAILERYPNLQSTVFDQPAVRPIAERCIAQHGLGDRIRVIGGSFFDDALPGPVDIVLLSGILHNWSPENARRILRRCAQALIPGGTLLISEQVLTDDRTGPLPGILCSLNMMIMMQDAREYSRGEFEAMLADTGFYLLEVRPTGGARQLLVARSRPTSQ